MKKKVCVIGAFPPPINGNSKALSTLVESELFRGEFDCCVVDLARIYQGKTGKLSFDKILGVFKLNRQLRRVMANEDVDIFYLSISQNVIGTIRDIVILRQIYNHNKNAKVVLHLHGGGFKNFYHGTSCLLKYAIRKYFSKASKGIVLGEALRDMFDGILPKEKVEIVANCVDDRYLISHQDFLKKIDDLSDTKRRLVVYLSNMVETKGYDDVYEAALKTPESYSDVYFSFAGKFRTDRERELFEEKLEKNIASKRILYLGVVEEEQKLELLREGSIFILPTYYPNEGQPISILEAMASGMPVITTDHAGIKDVIKDSINGLIVPAKDPDAIVNAVVKLLNSDEMMKSIAKRNRMEALEKYCEARYINELINIFLHV